MIDRLLRMLFRREREAIEASMADLLTEVIVKNNEQLEADLVEMGVLEWRDGQLYAKSGGS